jgi:hypothetical protein
VNIDSQDYATACLLDWMKKTLADNRAQRVANAKKIIQDMIALLDKAP